MANRNVDYSIRKPRKTKGTPFYQQRNLFALGVIALGGVCWWLYELWPQSKKLKKDTIEGKFKYSPEVQQHILSLRLGNQDPALAQVISKLREREQKKQDEQESRPQPWISKLFSTMPDQ